MKRLILLLLLGSFVGCQTEVKEIKFDDMAGRVSGRYVVNSYVINGDTVYSSSGTNKIKAEEFYIYLTRIKSDSLQMSLHFKETGATSSPTFIKYIGVNETNGVFQLSLPGNASSDYEGTITDNTFSERTGLGVGGFLIKPPIPLPVTDDPALKGVFISAVRSGN